MDHVCLASPRKTCPSTACDADEPADVVRDSLRLFDRAPVSVSARMIQAALARRPSMSLHHHVRVDGPPYWARARRTLRSLPRACGWTTGADAMENTCFVDPHACVDEPQAAIGGMMALGSTDGPSWT